MNRRVKIYLLVVALGGALLSGCMGFWGSDRSIATKVEITQDWTGIPIEPAINAKYRQQYISLEIPNIKWDAKFDAIYLEDGTTLMPELELVDEHGNVQRLRLSGRVRKNSVQAVFRPVEDFEKGRNFTMVRIRSDVPFRCNEMMWVDYDPK